MRTMTRLAIGSIALIAAAAAHAGSIDVFVGYADNLRASGFFPTGWIGSAGAVSQTPDLQSLDAGAVRIDNNTGAAIMISSFSVFFPNAGANFALWGSLTIPDGAHGIFTQTGSYNFDTSDFGIFAGGLPALLLPNNAGGNGNTSQIGGCSSSAAQITLAGYTAACNVSAPIITFFDGTGTQTLVDTGQILNTGGSDFVNYSADGNESINWNLVGSVANRGGNTGVPEPATIGLLGLALAGLGFARRRKAS